MVIRGSALALVLLTGCTRVVDGPPPQAEPPVAPITAGQVVDLLSPNVLGDEGNLFVTVEPEQCAGAAREVDPPFISDHGPAATDGGHWVADGYQRVHVEEMVGVFPADFDPLEAIADAKRSLESCRGRDFRITTMEGEQDTYTLLPPVDSGSPNILLWSFRAVDWACDNTYVAAHNAAIEITACAPTNGFDVAELAQAALNRIDALADTTA
ncbi:sensor domain-containing protein [Mycobacterium sp. IDR2000157661]|uniref:sensor domain-containing protein n=1 Tax=Mycobacterium sp. IDR2000157661 TaxID=2867005 RepID=UPI001EEDBD11|nr:sensor domain-containing protein [Mycobacterium sp. IDR2000157661]ULE35172.1 sensor domain-containing protein [Mycobacterium sp. IDR2000157661]